MGIFNFFSKKENKEDLNKGLEKTKEGVFSKLARAVAGKSKVDDEVLDNLEEVLITSDVGVDTTLRIIERIEKRVAEDKYMNTAELNGILRSEITALLEENRLEGEQGFDYGKKDGMPYVVMVVGVNGAGKTTTIGKLASKLRQAGQKVYIGAADTFRAAAADQLEIWANRAECEIVRSVEGADPGAVLFDSLAAAKARGVDVVLCDTAGRLHNKVNLMNELSKLRKIIDRETPDAAKETLLVLDATTGQNGLQQAKVFRETAGLTGIILTKLDGTAKGGICVAIAQELGVPVKYVGLGEGIDDLQPFNAEEYVKALI